MKVLAHLAPAPAGEIAYREEIHHPALVAPETAAGILYILPDGRFVKDQSVPRREISEVGNRYISIRKAPGDEPNYLPIAAEMQPVLLLLRHLVLGETASIGDDFEMAMEESAPGWRIRLVAKQQNPVLPIWLNGCGTLLEWIEISESSGVRRHIILGEHS